MENNLEQFFSETNFDFQEPSKGHEKRFEKKLNTPTATTKKTSWKWLSVAASVVLLVGFWLGSNHQKKQMELADVSPKMKEVENYFVNSIQSELKLIEKSRSLETEKVIEQALNQLEELEENYQVFIAELNTQGNTKKVIHAMIKNYQRRLDVLENVLEHIEEIKKITLIKNEDYV